LNPAARINETITLLGALSKSSVPMDSTIGDYMRYKRYIGSKDRSDIVERVYNIVRAHARLMWWLKKAGAEVSPRMLVLAWLMVGEGKEISAAQSLFDGSKYGPALLNNKEIKLIKKLNGKKLDDKNIPESVLIECPPEHEEALRSYFKDDFVQEMKAMIEGATLDLRVNTWRSDKEKIITAFKKDKIFVEDTPFCPWGLRAKGKVYLGKTKPFIKGWVEIQDEGSQLIAYACGAEPGKHVLDYCAGGGGKTLALAAVMKNKGRLVAMDIDKPRLERSRARFKRAGLHDVIEIRALSEEKNRKWLRRQKGTFDIVLVDVPCTGTGTWRRNPDTRWKSFGPSYEDLLNTQAEILDKVAKTVKIGGRLVYATCSLLPSENEEQIAKFLKEHPEFSVSSLPENIPGEGPYMRLTPYRHNTDGFFAAILERKA
jgi:16S rRNA (cytosine967-C5)-methyltransferase